MERPNPLYSTAIQNHILSKYIPQTRKKSLILSARQKQLLKWSRTSSPSFKKVTGQDVDMDANKSTLAQKLEIIPSDNISQTDWARIKQQALGRLDLSCPICQEGFSNSTQIILNCSHIFHAICFTSFERLSAQKQCPVCRKSDYKRLKTKDASEICKTRAAIIIQKHWRGYHQRLKFWKDHELINPLSKHKQLYREMHKSGKEMQRKLKNEADILSKVFEKLDEEYLRLTSDISNMLLESRISPRLKSKDDIYWDRILVKVLRRGTENCAICLQIVKLPNNNKSSVGTTILSCSHCLHKNCYISYKSFFSNPSCPVCRADEFKAMHY